MCMFAITQKRWTYAIDSAVALPAQSNELRTTLKKGTSGEGILSIGTSMDLHTRGDGEVAVCGLSDTWSLLLLRHLPLWLCSCNRPP
jgi:hypothetical protein